ncbi:hypothetical protein [Bailinhaonella thermotolerans]|uniref:Uncharacterized protein n=1 Tax=Bailinhaonella thermotolerans TaxID=1070861 RepID=A0A3A4A3I2_9ACTN|nr:hypothetical protein [Bailinhaonella thermotolerans]RJL23005.1 hypothetical protein D5H75_34050 [Bailinhaonella thermotolerans]
MTLLEARYRRVLRLLPAHYRAEREEEMVDAFLEGAADLDEDEAHPRWSEVLSVAALAVRVRLGGAGSTARGAAWGEAVRLAAVAGLFLNAMTAAQGLAAEALVRAGVIGPVPEEFRAVTTLGVLATAAGVAWVAAFAALARGRLRVAKAAAVLGLVPLPVEVVRQVIGGVPAVWVLSILLMGLVGVIPVLALLAGYHRDAAAPRLHWAMPLAPPAAGLLAVVAILALAGSPTRPTWVVAWLDLPGLGFLALAGLSVWHARTGRTASPAWPLALALLAFTTLASRLGTIAVSLSVGAPGDPLLAGAAVQAGVLLALGLVLLGLGRRALPSPAPAVRL